MNNTPNSTPEPEALREGRKLSTAQRRFMSIVDGTALGMPRDRREKDGTVVPYFNEKRTVDALVRHGVLKWVSAGQDGYTYSGVVRAPITGGSQ